MKQIKIGTLVNNQQQIEDIIDYGFESFSLTFWENLGEVSLKEQGKKISDFLGGKDATMSSVSIFCNALNNEDDIKLWEQVIDNAKYFNTNLVTGFTGRIVDESIDGCMPRFKTVFTDLCKRAKDQGVKIAFENCDMGGTWDKGTWNIAHNPIAWEMMFDVVPLDNIGLQWEPCHQMVSLIDPIAQLKQWAPKIFNVHGKDATIDWDIIKKHGIHGPKKFAWHRTPGFGDSNWTNIISILRTNGYEGSIDIEGYHDPVYRGEWELTGQVHGLNYLKQCRGGLFIPNPDSM